MDKAARAAQIASGVAHLSGGDVLFYGGLELPAVIVEDVPAGSAFDHDRGDQSFVLVKIARELFTGTFPADGEQFKDAENRMYPIVEIKSHALNPLAVFRCGPVVKEP